MINPECRAPMYLLPPHKAARCGSLGGVVKGVIFGLLACFLYAAIESNHKKKKNVDVKIWVVGSVVGATVGLVVFALSWYVAYASALGGLAEKKVFLDRGLSEQEATTHVQNIENSRMNASAIRSAGLLTAAAIAGR